MVLGMICLLSLLSSVYAPNPGSRAGDIFEDPFTAAERTELLNTCRSTGVCCLRLHSIWLAAATERRTYEGPILESYVPSTTESAVTYDSTSIYVNFFCSDVRRTDEGRPIEIRRSGPNVMVCPRTDAVYWYHYKSKLNGFARKSAVCGPRSAQSREVAAGTSDCIDLQNMKVIAQEAEAWITTLRNENMKYASYIDWSEVLPYDGWTQRQADVDFSGPIVIKPQRKYRVCARAPIGTGNMLFHAGIIS